MVIDHAGQFGLLLAVVHLGLAWAYCKCALLPFEGLPETPVQGCCCTVVVPLSRKSWAAQMALGHGRVCYEHLRCRECRSIRSYSHMPPALSSNEGSLRAVFGSLASVRGSGRADELSRC